MLENDESETVITNAKYSFITGALKETFQNLKQSEKTRSEKIDSVLTHPLLGFPIFSTILFLIFYLVFLLYVGFSSTHYALKYGEESYSAWAPPMAPIKIIMCVGIALMLLQAVAVFFKHLATATGRPIETGRIDGETSA